MASALGSRARRRVPGRQPDPGRHRAPAASGRARADRRRRRRAGGLRVPRRRQRAPAGARAPPSRPPASVRLERNFRSRQPLLDLANVVRPAAGGHRLVLRADRDGQRRGRGWSACHDASATRRARSSTPSSHAVERRAAAARAQAVLMRSAHHSDLLEVELTARRVPYVKYGGLQVPRSGARQGLPRRPAPARTTRSTRSPGSGCCGCTTGIGPARARGPARRACSPTPTREPDHNEVVAAAPAASRARGSTRRWLALRGARVAAGPSRPASRAAWTLLRPLRASPATPTAAPGSATSTGSSSAAAAVARPRRLRRRGHARPAGQHQRLRPPAAPRRGLPRRCPRCTRPKGWSGTTRPRHPRRRRRVPVRHGAVDHRRPRRGAAAVLRRRHPGPRRARRLHAAADAAPPHGPATTGTATPRRAGS